MDESTRTSNVLFIRNFVFGVEDSLVSTVGLLSGIAAGGGARHDILLSGTVLIFVEAFSMAVGSFLSEESSEEYVARAHVSARSPALAGGTMFVSYFVSGFIPLFPYYAYAVGTAFWVSIVLSLSALLLLGVVSGRLSRTNIVWAGVRMLVMGGFAVAIGITVGMFVK